jgi:hypothetical protein
VRRLLVAASVIPSSTILVTLMKEALDYSETSVLTRATRRNNPEDTILQQLATLHYSVRVLFPLECDVILTTHNAHRMTLSWAVWTQRDMDHSCYSAAIPSRFF